jgi:hypothetical protein
MMTLSLRIVYDHSSVVMWEEEEVPLGASGERVDWEGSFSEPGRAGKFGWHCWSSGLAVVDSDCF